MIRPVVTTPTSAWMSWASRSSRNDWSTLRPNQARTLKSWAVLANPFLNFASRPEIGIVFGPERGLAGRSQLLQGPTGRSWCRRRLRPPIAMLSTSRGLIQSVSSGAGSVADGDGDGDGDGSDGGLGPETCPWRTRSRMPLTNRLDWAVEYRLASSSASLRATRAGTSG